MLLEGEGGSGEEEGEGLMGSKCQRRALCRPSPNSGPLAFLRHLQALGLGWVGDALTPPCWCTEQKDEVWFQLRGQGAGVDVR